MALDTPCVSEVLEDVSLVPCSVTSVHSLFHTWLPVLLQPDVLAILEPEQPKMRPASLAGEVFPAAGWRQHAHQFIHSLMADSQVSLSKPTPLGNGAL